ncbi:MAG TPA: amino acid deaminase [Thermoanaerobaculia bacterium]|jgi:D-serine dehydratase|nr:amino acid deaminase [Thermoanaerobaculia bacterium]
MRPLDKGIGALAAGSNGELPSPGWNLLAEELSLPAAVLYEERLAHNLRWMQSFIDEYGLNLAPHGKTTMAPKLFHRQLEAGAWGLTVATAQQALVAFRHGVPRVLMANLLVGRRNLEMVAEALVESRAAAHGRFAFYCLVDSPRAVEHLGRFFRPRSLAVDVLLELGPLGGRTGARDAAQEEAVLRALDDWSDTVRLAGVEVYEGVLKEESDIRAFLRRAAGVLARLIAEGRVKAPRPILSGAGSAWYDVVAEEFAGALPKEAVDVVLRPGCYLTHDVGLYRAPQARILKSNPIAQRMQGGLLPALQIWAYVLSVPEPERAIVGLGKRDVAFDAGYPTPAVRFRPGADERPSTAPAHWAITDMMDQHAYLRIAPGDDLQVGDMLGLDVSHPCLTFDKWRQIAVLDRDYRVLELVQTFF